MTQKAYWLALVFLCGCSLAIKSDLPSEPQTHSEQINERGDKKLSSDQEQLMRLLEAELRSKSASDNRLALRREGLLLAIKLQGDDCFDHHAHILKPQAAATLKTIAGILVRYPATVIRIQSHTDNQASSAINLDLSTKQAQSVKQAMLNHSVQETRLTIYAAGETQPAASNRTPEGRAKNRRIEILIEPEG